MQLPSAHDPLLPKMITYNLKLFTFPPALSCRWVCSTSAGLTSSPSWYSSWALHAPAPIYSSPALPTWNPGISPCTCAWAGSGRPWTLAFRGRRERFARTPSGRSFLNFCRAGSWLCVPWRGSSATPCFCGWEGSWSLSYAALFSSPTSSPGRAARRYPSPRSSRSWRSPRARRASRCPARRRGDPSGVSVWLWVFWVFRPWGRWTWARIGICWARACSTFWRSAIRRAWWCLGSRWSWAFYSKYVNNIRQNIRT